MIGMKLTGLFLVIIMISLSCSNQADEFNYISTLVKEMTGREIIFPDSLSAPGGYSCSLFKGEAETEKYKIVSIISGECMKCVYQLAQWESDFFPLTDENHVTYVFILTNMDIGYYQEVISTGLSINRYIYFDQENLFMKLNRLVNTDERFHTFLLDRSNRIKVIGNPLYNKELKELYLKKLNEAEDIKVKYCP